MSQGSDFDGLSREDRIALCQEVMENLSELVEGTAPADFCEKVETMLGSCQPYLVYKDTLAATLDLLKECGGNSDTVTRSGAESYARGVARAREALMKRRKEEKE